MRQIQQKELEHQPGIQVLLHRQLCNVKNDIHDHHESEDEQADQCGREDFTNYVITNNAHGSVKALNKAGHKGCTRGLGKSRNNSTVTVR